MVSILDSHTHLDLVEERGIERTEYDALLRENGVEGVVQIAAAPSTMQYARGVAHEERDYEVYYTAGFHPAEVEEQSPDDGEDFIREHHKEDKFVAIGEIGLDYYYGAETREKQIAVFRRFLELAVELDQPVAIHTRDAHEDTLELLAPVAQKIPVLIHCFTGNADQAKDYLEIGTWISYSGIVTFKNADSLREAALITPLEKMLVETDAPYLTPVPVRGKTNQPGYVRHTLRFLAELRGVEEDELARVTNKNTREFFRLPARAGGQDAV